MFPQGDKADGRRTKDLELKLRLESSGSRLIAQSKF